MASFIELIAKIKQKNNGDYPLVDAEDIECEDGKRLNVVLNEKLDKNQGVENAGKTMIVGDDGNLVVGDSSPKNVYTKEEVDYLLDDKMDKPYVPIEITDNATITDALEGNFKIDMIKGNTYQNVEENIVPTPDRPVPINSRKVLANGEYVELRSLKETGNLFDLKYGQLLFGEKVGSTTNNGSGVIIENQYAITVNLAVVYLKANTNYCFKSNRAKEPIEGMEESGNDLNMLGVLKGSTPIIQVISGNTFTVNDSGYYYLRLYGTVGCKVSYTSIMLVEGTSAPSTYVAPTVRDYKIVDHANKTAKIIRNVRQRLLTAKDNFYRSVYGGMEINLKDGKLMNVNESAVTYCNLFNYHVDTTIPNNLCYRLYSNYLQFNYDGYNDKTLWDEFITDNELYIQYQLANPTEEEIAYSADDVSEVGYSWQDTTSPSLDIKSEIYQVDKIDIKSVGKNFIDINYISNIENWTNSNTDGYYYIPIAVPKNAQLVISNDVKVPAGRGYFANFSPYKEKNAENYYFIYHNDIGSALGKFTSITKSNVVYLRLNSINVNLPSFVEDFKKMQLEIGSVATPYEPYQEISIQHTLSKPLRATKDGSVRDAIDIVNMQTTYNITDFTVDGNTTIALGTDKEKTRVIQINNQPFLNPTNNLKMYCDKLLNDSGKDEELFTVSTALFIAINKNRVEANDINAFKKWFGENPLYFIGISKTPTTEPLEDELVEKLKTLKTFSSVTHVFVEGVAKPKLNARYPKDIAAAQAQLEAKVITLQEAVIKNV